MHIVLRHAFILLVLAAIAFGGPSLESYVGQYVFKVGGRNFIVLNVHRVDGKWAGTFARPQHAHFRLAYSKISNESLTEPIISSVRQNGHLHLVVRNPTKQHAEDELDLKLVGGGAELKPFGAPMPPWHLIRVPENPRQEVGKGWDKNCTYYPDALMQSNPQMKKIYAEDQKYRDSGWAEYKAHEKLAAEQDRRDREEVRKLLDEHALHSARDFAEAAFVFQHGARPDDYLLAHTLAIMSMALGDPSSRWIAISSLDRYLLSINHPQIYGTQMQPPKPGTTQRPREPYDRTLVPEYVRRQLGAPDPQK